MRGTRLGTTTVYKNDLGFLVVGTDFIYNNTEDDGPYLKK